jgi:hypothetical protein
MAWPAACHRLALALDGVDQLGHVDDATCILDALFEQARVVRLHELADRVQ